MSQTNERTRLIQDDNEAVEVRFEHGDREDPRQWPLHWKYIQVLLVFFLGLVLPMASSMFAPAIDDIAQTFEADKQLVLGGQAVFVSMLGIGPLFFAPMSETFGRRKVFLLNVTLFCLTQIPTALAPNIETWLAFRLLSGLFASVGVANGGGTVSDLFEASERATVSGFYFLAPLLAPTLGPFFASLLLTRLDWRWIFWTIFILSAILSVVCYFLLFETQAMVILQERKHRLQKENPDKKYVLKGTSDQSLFGKVAKNSTTATKILFSQPIVLVISIYQALVFSSMYSLYSNYTTIWSEEPYNFDTIQIGLAYLGPAAGFIATSFIVVPLMDPIYKKMQDNLNGGEGKPEYRLPLANIGAVCLPISLFWFGWTIEDGLHWPIPLAATLFFGASQIFIFNSFQNYYIDAFESKAASALAAGAFLRSIIGGVVPLFIPKMFDSLGYGLGFSVFGIVSIVLMPAPLLFMRYGGVLREKFSVEE
ncbi:putative Major facilitator superfamily domain-containing protein [Seiridium cardinale]|uniref:Major facilitator superfamily domain-containing protein n=1 Tax=Seiridium cardinale TaxID=138064 RepID=A0ABR2X8M4_9PEZI